MLVKDDVPRGCWKLAKIESLSSSRDGEIRSAKVQLSSGRVIGRPLNMLYPLEITENKEECDNQNEFSEKENIQSQVRPKRSTVEETMRRIKQSLQ